MRRFELLTDRLRRKEVLLLDGAMGTEIQRRGVSTALPLWSAGALLSHPEIVKQIHEDYIEAGADIITTNTFRTNRRTMEAGGLKGGSAEELTRIACNLAYEAREEMGRNDVLIAGGMAPLEDCYRVDLVPSSEELEEEHAEWAASLAQCGVDFLFVETMNCVRETNIALRQARATGLPAAVSFVPSKEGTMLSGESVSDLLEAILPLEPFAILCNCRPPETVTTAVDILSDLCPVPFGAYANGLGHPDDAEGWKFEGGTSEQLYTDFVRQWIEKGALIVGGCCGTTPASIRSIVPLLEN